MHFSSFVALAAPFLVLPVAQAVCQGTASGHRRHHAKLTATSGTVFYSTSTSPATSASSSTSTGDANLAKQGTRSQSVAFSSTASSAHASATASASSSSSNSSSSSTGLSGVSKNGIYVGFLPDDASGGGTSESLQEINSELGVTSAIVGFYAQAQQGQTFDGSQFTYRSASILGASVFVASVMPTGGFSGYSGSDTSQAQNIANVVKTWADQGVEVWLRFGHEMNWYLTDGTYTGTASEFIAAFQGVADAVRATVPSAKMFWCPNVASMSEYAQYYPGSSYVDVVGVDYYPSSVESNSFLSTMQTFHDTYAVDGAIYAVGETGLGQAASISDRLAWAEQITSSAVSAAMPQYKAMCWFNYYKGYDFRIALTDGDSATASFLA